MPKKNPKITVITVVKNSEKYLEKNIKSLMNQSYKNYEHIIIDGSSTDKSMEIAAKYKDNIHKIISEEDNGLYDAMNKGIKNANGDIIGILNSDDYYNEGALEIVKNYFEDKSDIDFLFGSVIKHKHMYGYYPWRICWTFNFYTAHSVGFFIKKEAQLKVGFYDTKYKYSADYDLFYRMIVKMKMKGMATKKNEIFGKFRRGGISSKLSNNDFLREIYKVRVGNGQNKIFVLFLLFLKYSKYNLKKILKL